MKPQHSHSPSPHFEASVHRSFVERVATATHARAETNSPTSAVIGADGKPPGKPDLGELSAAVGVSIAELTQAYAEARRSAYSTTAIPKRNGGIRIISEPPPCLKAVQRRLLNWFELQPAAKPHDCAHGFVKGRSHVTHAIGHVGRQVVASVDVQDCFGSITDLHLWLELKHVGLSEGALAALIELVTIEAHHEPRKYRRSALTQALEIVDGVLQLRYPITWVVLAARSPVPQTLEDLVRKELNLPDGPLLRRADVERPSWSAPAQRLAAFRHLMGDDEPARSRHRLLDVCLSDLAIPPQRYRSTEGRIELTHLRAALIESAEHLPEPLSQQIKSVVEEDQCFFRSIHDGAALTTQSTSPWQLEKNMVPMNYRILPQGAPTSPLLCNIALRGVDRQVARYCATVGLNYTRYADDLAFSGDALPPNFVATVAKILQEQGLRVNRDKVNANWQDSRQVVTGLVVNARLAPVALPRRSLRAMRHHLRVGRPAHINLRVEKPAHLEPDPAEKGTSLTESATLGWLAYWHMVDSDRVPDAVRALKGE